MQYPKEVLTVVEKCEKRYPNIENAVKKAEAQIRALSTFSDFVDLLVRRGVQELVSDARHATNTDMRNEMRVYGGPAKVVVGKSKGVQKTEADLFSYRINGSELGSIMGEELEGLANNEFERGNGYLFRGRLLLACRPLTPDGKAVRESMTPSQLYKVWKKAEGLGGTKKK
jgi:hypothetical protein